MYGCSCDDERGFMKLKAYSLPNSPGSIHEGFGTSRWAVIRNPSQRLPLGLPSPGALLDHWPARQPTSDSGSPSKLSISSKSRSPSLSSSGNARAVVKYLRLAFRERAAVQLGFSFLVNFSVALGHGLPIACCRRRHGAKVILNLY